MSFADLNLKVRVCNKCKHKRKVLIFGGVKLCEGCLYQAKAIIKKWVGKK